MKVTNSLEDEEFRLTNAILLRKSTASLNSYKADVIASIHKINFDKKSGASIGAGELMTESGLKSLVKMMVPEQSIQFLPERVLAFGVEGVVWWKAPSVEMVWFNTNDSKDGIGIRGGSVPLPGLVFFARPNGWAVFAVKGNQRPNLDTQLFQAPFYNVYSSGEICTGNAEIPKSVGIDDIDGFERGFFGSRFTHPNVHSKSGLTKYRGGAGALWKSLLSGKRKEFPENSLVATRETLKTLLNAKSSKGVGR